MKPRAIPKLECYKNLRGTEETCMIDCNPSVARLT